MSATMTTVDAILKEIYGPRIENQLQDEIVAKKRIERTSDGVVETVGGKYVDFPIRVSRNHGMGYRNENEQLPAAKRQGYAEVHVPLKFGYGRVRLTGQLMKLAEKNTQAFASAMDREMNGIKDDVVKDQNRICYGDGSGLLATINDTAVSTTHNVLNAQYLEVGMQVDVLIKSNGTTVLLNTEITDVNGLAITFGGSFTGATTQGLYRQGSYGREPTGFDRIVDNTLTLHGLDPALQRKWKAEILANGGTQRALSEGLMISAVDQVRPNGGKTSVILTSLGVRRAYFNLLTQQRRFSNTKEFAGGFSGLEFHHGRSIPVVEDTDAPPNKMWGLDEDKFKVYRSEGWHWADEDGTTLKWVTDYDAWECFLREFSEMGVSHRNAQWAIEDVTEG